MFKMLIFGATGAVGREVLKLVLADPSFDEVIAPTRRPISQNLGLALVDSARIKLSNPIMDFSDFDVLNLPENANRWSQVDCAVCCIGTTLKIAGTRKKFYAVDHDIVIQTAKQCKQNGIKHFIYNSSLGASVNSDNFYLKTKGKVEADLSKIGFEQLTIVRPSLLYGAKRKPFRIGEAVGILLALSLKWLIPSRYRAVSVQQVAKVMVTQAKLSSQNKGYAKRVIENTEISELTGQD